MSALRHITLPDMLKEAARLYAQSPAIEYEGRVITYEELSRRVDAAAKGLIALGMLKGSHVAIWEDDRPGAIVCFYAAVSIGAVAVMPGTSLKTGEMSILLNASDVDMLLYGDGYRDVNFLEAVKSFSPLPAFYIGEAGNGMDKLFELGEGVDDKALSLARAAVAPEDTAAMLFTSGTMGASRGVLTSHFSRVNNAIIQAKDIFSDKRDKFLVAIPMFHCFSLSANIIGAMSAGACLCLPRSRHTGDILSCIEDCRCTVFHAVPALLHALICREDFDRFDLSSLRIGLVGGTPLDGEQMRAFRERLKCELLPSLGLTEATAGITVASPSDALEVKLNTVGHFMDHVEGKIADPNTGEALPAGEAGEILVRGYCVMQGYYASPDETRQVIDANGFLHTGDLGYLDEDGNLHFCGRLKEVIIRGGENISPGEIEACILTDRRVAMAKVVGVKHAHYGEALCACVVKKPGALITASEIRALVARKLAYYKSPDYVVFFDELPMSVSGKARTALIRDMARQKIQEENMA